MNDDYQKGYAAAKADAEREMRLMEEAFTFAHYQEINSTMEFEQLASIKLAELKAGAA